MIANAHVSGLANGTLFAGRYRIRSLIATGGMGAVYAAEQISTGALRALKLLHPQFIDDARMRQRFDHEARLEARIESDHVVRVIESGIDEAQHVPWIAMEYLEGEDLHATLERRGALPADEVLEVMRQICDALAAAHRVDIVHRDLKPENVFISPSRQPSLRFFVKLLDFGIARMLAEGRTLETAPLGTPLWMAPEQTMPNSGVGPAADVWAIGLLAYRMLTGHYYWRGARGRTHSVMAIMREIAVEPIADASARAAEQGCHGELPAEFDHWFARCVNRDVDARFADAQEAYDSFAQLFAAPSAGVRSDRRARAGATDRGQQSHTGQWLPVICGASTLAVVGGVALFIALRHPNGVTPIADPGSQRGNESGNPRQQPRPDPAAPVPVAAVAQPDARHAACDGGDARTCAELAHARERGDATQPGDPLAALELYQKACGLGHASGCDEAARLVTGHDELGQSEQRKKVLHDACSAGFKTYCPKPTQNDLCRKGSAEACFKLAEAERSGRPQSALKHYSRSCQLGHQGGCQVILVLGVNLCDQGLAEGCTLTGTLLMHGSAGIRNPEMGRKLLTLGCKAGDASACEELHALGLL